MPSDRRLHPLSVVFGVGAQLRSMAVPAIVVLFSAGAAGLDWEIWLLLLLLPYTAIHLFRYLTLSYRYGDKEMVIRSGLVFTNERHVPYSRIQNLDAVQGIFHRLFKVAEVRLETGSGNEPEAILRVLPVAALEEMRRRVFEGRHGGAESAADPDAPALPAAEVRTTMEVLLHLPLRELMLYGLIQSRGFIVLAAAFGLIWELGFSDRLMGGVLTDRTTLRAVFGDGDLPLDRLGLMAAAFIGLLLLLRLLSMGWALVRLHGFRLVRHGDDLRTEFGLFTRVTATLPVHRIQSISIHEGPIHRLAGRVSVRVETAGGSGGGSDERRTQREWLAPILPRRNLQTFLDRLLPGLAMTGVEWTGAPPRAFRRALKPALLVPLLATIWLLPLLGWRYLLVVAAILVLAPLAARQRVRHLGWAVTAGAVFFKSGWLWRKISGARLGKVQTVALHESPFDRHHAMARIRVDTAGAGNTSHRVDIPYLPRAKADSLYATLSTDAARTDFQW